MQYRAHWKIGPYASTHPRAPQEDLRIYYLTLDGHPSSEYENGEIFDYMLTDSTGDICSILQVHLPLKVPSADGIAADQPCWLHQAIVMVNDWLSGVGICCIGRYRSIVN